MGPQRPGRCIECGEEFDPEYEHGDTVGPDCPTCHKCFSCATPDCPQCGGDSEIIPVSKPWIANVGEATAEFWKPDSETVCISITQPGCRARLPKGFAGVHRSEFQDYDSVDLHRNAHIPEGAVLFTANLAARIARFSRKHRGKNILVHCAAGVSRSAGIAEALLEAFPEYEDKGWPRYPNGLVKMLMKRALGLVPIGAEGGALK